MKILTVIGARPQFIKAATVSRKLKEKGITEILIHTGQHFDQNMSQVFFDEMDIPEPHYNLGIHSTSHAEMTGQMMVGIESIASKLKPDLLLVYGDTNSTMAGALAASKLHIPVAHVEAGLRSFNMQMPEEVNRIVTDHISKYLFCPTQTAFDNLSREGFSHGDRNVTVTGDVMYDSVVYYKQRAAERSGLMRTMELNGKSFILATLHRAENTNDPVRLKAICAALNEIHKTNQVVMPIHPRTRSYISQNNIEFNVTLIDPVGYFDMLALLEGCKLVMTDSGGLQKESYFFGKFCITLRDETEWLELVDAGVNALAGASTRRILDAWKSNINRPVDRIPSLYGDGNAAGKIVEVLNG
jgi:UDP-GlcNAc3NAcA epimerase